MNSAFAIKRATEAGLAVRKTARVKDARDLAKEIAAAAKVLGIDAYSGSTVEEAEKRFS